MNSTRISEIKLRWKMFGSTLDERQQRMWAAVEAQAYGRGGQVALSTATGISRRRIQVGMRELEDGQDKVPPGLFHNSIRTRGTKVDLEAMVVLKEQLIGQTYPCSEILDLFSGGELMNGQSLSFHWSTVNLSTLVKELNAKTQKKGNSNELSKVLKKMGFHLRRDLIQKVQVEKEKQSRQFSSINEAMKMALKHGQAVIFLDIDKRTCSNDEKLDWIEGIETDKIYTNSEEINDEEPASTVFINHMPSRLTLAKAMEVLKETQISRNLNESGLPVDSGLLIHSLKYQEMWKISEPDERSACISMHLLKDWWAYYGQSEYSSVGEILVCANGFESEESLRAIWMNKLKELAEEFGVGIRFFYIPPGIYRAYSILNTSTLTKLVGTIDGGLHRHHVTLNALSGIIKDRKSRVQKRVTAKSDSNRARVRPGSYDNGWSFSLDIR